jgi:hypothetical protein
VTPALKLRDGSSRELALILAASRGDPSRESIRTLMAGPIDWERLAQLAVDTHATPGVWNVVSAYPNLPPAARMLQRLAVVNDFRRYHIRTLVARVVDLLRRQGIEVLVLKGAALLAGGIGRPVARTMADIDVLVVEGSPEAAWQACRAAGWNLVDPAWNEELYKAHHHLPPLVDPEGVNVGLEVHRSILPGAALLGLDVGAFRSRARTVTIGSVPVAVPAYEDMLLHDCLHFAWANKLQRGAWRAFADAHTIVREPEFSWDRFLAVARGTPARQCSYWTLRLGRALGDLPVTDEVLEQLRPSSGAALTAMLERHFIRQILEPDAEAALSERARRWLWFRAMHQRGAPPPGVNPWSVGDVDLPGEVPPAKRAPRGALRAAISSCAYLTRLVFDG